MRESGDLRICREATSCGFDGDQLVPDLLPLHEPRTGRIVFEAQRCCFENIGPGVLPKFRFRKDRLAKRKCAVAAFLRVTNLEN